MNARYIVGIAMLMLMVIPAVALPATPTVTLISGANVTFSTTGVSNFCYFLWGQNKASPEWSTNNNTASGAYTDTQVGSPYWQCTTYYVQACDSTGCSAVQKFMSGSLSPAATTTFGTGLSNITQSHYSTSSILANMATPYAWAFGSAVSGVNALAVMIIFGMFVASYFIGLWLQNRGVSVGIIVGIILMRFIILPSQGLLWGLTGEWAMISEFICYAGIAGMVLALIKKG